MNGETNFKAQKGTSIAYKHAKEFSQDEHF